MCSESEDDGRAHSTVILKKVVLQGILVANQKQRSSGAFDILP